MSIDMNEEFASNDDDHPLKLKNLSLCKLINNPDAFSTKVNDEFGRQLNDGIYLTKEICEDLIKAKPRFLGVVSDEAISLFRDTERTSLKKVYLWNSPLSDKSLEILLRHNLQFLSLRYCDALTTKSYELFARYGESLKTFHIGYGTKFANPEDPYNNKLPADIFSTFSNLKQLILHEVALPDELNLLQLKQLTYLDMSSCALMNFSLQNLCELKNLQTLILYNARPLTNQIDAIFQLSKLQVLDISINYLENGEGTYNFPNQTLEKLIRHLPELTHLDISGTNLVTNDSNTIQELTPRQRAPLEFIGLYHTSNLACNRNDIPAKEISGNANEQQLLTACRYYLDRPEVLIQVMEELFHLFHSNAGTEKSAVMDLVLKAMDKHLKLPNVCSFGTIVLWKILKDSNRSEFGISFRNHVLRTIVNVMKWNCYHLTILRYGLVILVKFESLLDQISEYECLVSLLVDLLCRTNLEDMLQRAALELLGTMTCMLEARKKLSVYDMNVVSKVLDIIKDRIIKRGIFYSDLQTAWVILWQVTSLSQINCCRFAENHGAECTVRSLNAISLNEGILGNLMKILLNMTEIPFLRTLLMTTELVQFMLNILVSNSHGFKVNYRAVGILTNFAFEGPEKWSISTPKREDVLIRMREAIEQFDMNNDHDVNIRKIRNFFMLVQCYETPECQHWAAWTLAYLTMKDPVKYCQLVQRENGIQILTTLIEDSRPYGRIKELAQQVINQCGN